MQQRISITNTIYKMYIYRNVHLVIIPASDTVSILHLHDLMIYCVSKIYNNETAPGVQYRRYRSV